MKHSELLKDTRKWASIDASTYRKGILYTLADIVEQQDAIIAETVTACMTCDEVMTELLAQMEHEDQALGTDTREHWIEFRAARDLARRAAKKQTAPDAQGAEGQS